MPVKMRLFEILDVVRDDDQTSRYFDIFIMSLIAANVAAQILETVDSICSIAPEFFEQFEFVSLMIFSIEYVLRIWSCTANPKYSHSISGRVRFAFTPLLLIDFLAIIPFYIAMLPIDLRVIRALRLFRIFRILKLARYFQAIQVIGSVLRSKKEELITILFTLFLLLLLVSSLVYFVEHEAQPESFSSIPAAMWWGIVTLTTVGYGDMYPVTLMGKFFAALVAILGIGMFALPAGILGSGFVEHLQNKGSGQHRCPHCGKELSPKIQTLGRG